MNSYATYGDTVAQDSNPASTLVCAACTAAQCGGTGYTAQFLTDAAVQAAHAASGGGDGAIPDGCYDFCKSAGYTCDIGSDATKNSGRNYRCVCDWTGDAGASS